MPSTRRLVGFSFATVLTVLLLSEAAWMILKSLGQTYRFEVPGGAMPAYLLGLAAGSMVWSVGARYEQRWEPFGLGIPRRMLVVPVVCLVLAGSAALAALLRAFDGVYVDVDLGFANASGQRKLLFLFMGAASEELMDRFLIFGMASALARSPLIGVAVSTGLFALGHDSHSTFWFIAAGGLMFAAIYLYTRTIWASILAHFLVNVLIESLFTTSELVHPRLLDRSVGVLFEVIFSVGTVALSTWMLWVPLKQDRFVSTVIRWWNARRTSRNELPIAQVD